jgi:hypothetical protein
MGIACYAEGPVNKLGTIEGLKASNHVELAKYAVANHIAEEPAFKWWVSNTLHKWNHIISKVKKKYWRMRHKFGIKLLQSVEEALEIDRIMGTDHWRKALNSSGTDCALCTTHVFCHDVSEKGINQSSTSLHSACRFLADKCVPLAIPLMLIITHQQSCATMAPLPEPTPTWCCQEDGRNMLKLTSRLSLEFCHGALLDEAMMESKMG